MLTIEPERNIREETCDRCGRQYRQLTLFIHRDGDAFAICYASLHRHEDVPEAWLDVILSLWDEENASDHVTFGCRVGPVQGQDEPAASLVTGAIPFSDSDLFGKKLTRDEALVHPWLPRFWEVVDFVLVTDADVHTHVYG